MHQSPKTCYMALGLVPSVSLLKMGFSLGAPGALWAVHTGAKYTPTHSARWHQPGPVYAFRQHKGWQWLTHKKTHLYWSCSPSLFFCPDSNQKYSTVTVQVSTVYCFFYTLIYSEQESIFNKKAVNKLAEQEVGATGDQNAYLLESRAVKTRTKWLPVEWDQMYGSSVN